MNINVDGYNICYKISGNGEKTAVMLQGWGTSLELYDTVANTINGKYRFIQLDFPGFGGSDEPREPWNVDAYGDFFCHFMKTLGITKASLIGHSYGGRVIIKLANRTELPFEIEKIALIDSAGIVPKKSLAKRIKIRQYKILKKVFGNKIIYALFPELVEDWRSRQGSADYRNASPMMRQCMVMAVNEDLTHLLSGIRQETLLIWGDRDTETPLSDAKIMEERIKGSGLAVIEGAGHFPFLERPLVFDSVMKSYFGIGAMG